MTKPNDDVETGVDYTKDAGRYLSQYAGSDYAPTKAEHDRRVALTGRNYTDDGPRLRRTLQQEATPNAARPSSSPNA